ncbi:hypothetical protein ACFV1L_36045 [Kitasatospora sp. NPDC059646]|uniref:hypothetical protein n=1 Tax=Kitasatospora sp. NPDC059646 TaxID=3346893 RepID=UPI0036A01542
MQRTEARAALGVPSAVLAICAAVAGLSALGWAHSGAALDRATAAVDGRVEEIERGRGALAVVTWTDANDVSHTERLPLSDPDRYRPGDSYPLRYDPAAAHPRAVPAQADDLTDRRDEYLVPLVLAVLAAAGTTTFWGLRALLHLRIRRAPATPGRARGGQAPLGHATARPVVHVQWHTADGRPREGWQPVMAGPAAASLRAGDPQDATAVLVHQRTADGRLVIALPDGTRLIPAGPLRPRRPRHWNDSPEPPPLPGTPPPLPHGWRLRCILVALTTGAVAAPVVWWLTSQAAATAALTVVLAASAATGMWLREVQRVG